MLKHLSLAIVTFIVTNIDDLLLLTLYFADSRYKTKSVVAGQYAGILVLIGVSMLGLLLGRILDPPFVSMLGLLPMYIGISALFSFRKGDEDANEDKSDQQKESFQFVSVALVTIANGGDNIGVYAPLFATIPIHFIYLYVLLFLVLTGVWCMLGYWSVKHPAVKKLFSNYGKMILPVFLIVLGLFILQDFFSWLLLP
jgi:cadmium resistance protein CadD (predicted permease)